MESKTYLNDRFFGLFAVLTFLSILSLAYGPVLLIALGGFAGLGLLLWADWRGLEGPEVFTASLSYPRSPELGKELRFRFRIVSESERLLGLPPLELRTPPLRCLAFESRLVRLSPRLEEGQVIYESQLPVRPVRLGFETIEKIGVVLYSRRALWIRSLSVPVEECHYRVMPSSEDPGGRRFSEMVSAQRLIHQGNRYLTRSRAADQFHSIREYQYPDSIRHIDYKRTAKFNRLMTRTYDSYYNHHLILALDLGRSMCGELAGSNKHDYHLAACLALAQNALTHQDHVSFFAFTQRIHYLIPKTKALAPFRPLFRGHSALDARQEESNYDLINHTVSRIAGQRSIVLVFTDATKHSIQESLQSNLAILCRNHLTVVVSLLDREYTVEQRLGESGSSLTFDAYTRLLYACWLDEQVRLFRERLVRIGGAVLYIPQNHWMSVVARLYELLRQSYSI